MLLNEERMPTAQSYEHHIHHPIPTYIANLFLLAALVCFTLSAWLGWKTQTLGLFSLALSVFTLIAIGRIYTVKLQDRIILLEMRERCSGLLPNEQARLLTQLTDKQVFALRFASDLELGELLTRAVRENMSPDSIKRAVRHWRPDHLRT
jgi:hypothetical protein